MKMKMDLLTKPLQKKQSQETTTKFIKTLAKLDWWLTKSNEIQHHRK